MDKIPKLTRILVLLTKCENLDNNNEDKLRKLISNNFINNIYNNIDKCYYTNDFYNKLLLWLLGINHTTY